MGLLGLIFGAAAFNRARKWGLFRREFTCSPDTTVLNVGFTDEEVSPSANYLEKHYPYRNRITAVSLQVAPTFRQRYPDVRTVCADGVRLPFRDRQFDICWSNAVLEHVGDRDQQEAFLRELHRVAKTGYITTPNRWFPFEIHTRTPLLHYLPKRWFETYLRCIGKSWAAQGYMWLLSKRELSGLLDRAGFRDYRIINNRLGPLTIDFVVIFKGSEVPRGS